MLLLVFREGRGEEWLVERRPGAGLPDAYITVVHRSDGSGTTYIFSNYLSAVSPAWASKVGTGKTLNWPVGQCRLRPVPTDDAQAGLTLER